jgi:hypothetical protein
MDLSEKMQKEMEKNMDMTNGVKKQYPIKVAYAKSFFWIKKPLRILNLIITDFCLMKTGHFIIITNTSPRKK